MYAAVSGNENWFALCLSILKNKSVTESLVALGINSGNDKISEALKNKKREIKSVRDKLNAEQIKEMYKSGMSTDAISKKLGCSRTTISNFMKEHNIPRRKCGSGRQENEYRKNN